MPANHIFFLMAFLFASSLRSFHAQNETETTSSMPLLIQPAEERCENTEVSEAKVVSHIFRNYSKQTRPRRNGSETVQVQVGLSLFGITKFVEVESFLVLNGYISLLWKDDFLRYNEFPYNCIDYMYVDADQVWAPNLSFMSGYMEHDPSLYPSKGTKVSITNDGSLEVYPMGQITVKCELDLALFPFDEQICTVVLESWSYPNRMQSLVLFEPSNTSALAKVDNMWVENELWEIVDNYSVIIHPIYFPYTEQVFDRALFTLLLRRKSLFYRVHIVLPSLIIAVAELVTFVLPIAEVVKLEISFTCLLAYMVFEQSALSEMPKSSQTVPFLSVFITLQMAYIGLVAITGEAVVYTLIRQATYKKPPPRKAFRIFLKIGKIVFFECENVCRKGTKITAVSPCENIVNNESNVNAANELNERTSSVVGLHQRQPTSDHVSTIKSARRRCIESHVIFDAYEQTLSVREQWLYIAEVIERCNMVVYIVAIIVTPSVMFSLLPPPKHLAKNNALVL